MYKGVSKRLSNVFTYDREAVSSFWLKSTLLLVHLYRHPEGLFIHQAQSCCLSGDFAQISLVVSSASPAFLASLLRGPREARIRQESQAPQAHVNLPPGLPPGSLLYRPDLLTSEELFPPSERPFPLPSLCTSYDHHWGLAHLPWESEMASALFYCLIPIFPYFFSARQ